VLGEAADERDAGTSHGPRLVATGA
jgi:hypothetical protein